MINKNKIKIVKQMVNKLKLDLNINNKRFSNDNLVNCQRNWPIVFIKLDNQQKILANMYLQFTNKFIKEKLKIKFN